MFSLGPAVGKKEGQVQQLGVSSPGDTFQVSVELAGFRSPHSCKGSVEVRRYPAMASR